MDSIKNRWDKIKPWLGPVNFLLLAVLSFGLGRLTKIDESREPVRIESAGLAAQVAGSEPPEIKTDRQSGQLVGSKNGGKYHYPWCAGAARIKEENKIWFQDTEEAKRAGYTPAANCPGLAQ
ncbi:MAG: hypothetical protein HYT46_00090 [Candidatus Vogelbacteria bacterium]|nr:hypothetical protein [Candidatus Vogelbacteria bacterium]